MSLNKRDLTNFSLSNMTDTSYYWLGFLLADGHFRKIGTKSTELSVELNAIDLNHLQKLLLFLGRNIDSFTTRKRQTALVSYIQEHVSFRICDYDVLPKLTSYFNIVSNKTEIAPSVDCYKHINKDFLICLLIGFIDGDGYVRGRKSTCDGKIEGKKSWFAFYVFLNSLLTKSTVKLVHRDDKKSKDFSVLYLSSQDVKYLFTFAKTHNLPILKRKWESVEAAMAQTICN